MNKEIASIEITQNGNTIKVSGSEKFVTDNIKKYADTYIVRNVNNISYQTSAARNSNIEPEQPTLDDDISTIVSESKNGEIQINGQILGKNKAEKIKNTALLLGLKRGETETTSKELSAECSRQACLDKNNLAKVIKNDLSDFKISAKPKAKEWTFTLTVPGKRRAETLLRNMLEQENE